MTAAPGESTPGESTPGEPTPGEPTPRFTVLVPARMASSRLPDKPLAIETPLASIMNSPSSTPPGSQRRL